MRRRCARHRPSRRPRRAVIGRSIALELPPGRIRPVVRLPAEVLSRPCDRVDPESDEVVALAADLLATMAVSPGCVGLAANQVGSSLRVFSLNVTGHPKTRTSHGAFVLCNPELVAASRNAKGREGCMSVPDWTGDVKRATRIEVAGTLPGTGEQVVLATDAFEAIAIQHEIDHLDGLLFLDRLPDARALHRRVNYQ
ncbi:MAG: peptide deformylase [Actinobacteria bacterium]|nr:peptide deformylase [Actinomycetota bacterium]